MIDNPTNYPDPGSIAKAEEPIAEAHILSPTEYVGNIMELCQERRGVFIDMKYLEPTRVDIHYQLPLNEIVYDFFDALKSRTKGYASFDYELKDYVPSELVKLDILLNGEMVDALSFIVYAGSAYPDVYKRQGRGWYQHPRLLRRCFMPGKSPPCRILTLVAENCKSFLFRKKKALWPQERYKKAGDVYKRQVLSCRSQDRPPDSSRFFAWFFQN